MPRQQAIKLFIDGVWVEGDGETISVVDKYSGQPIGFIRGASTAQVDAAVAAARRSFESIKLEPHERYRLLMRVADLIETNREALAELIISESGVPWKDSNNEVGRAAETFRLSAEEARRLVGEMVPIQGAAGQSHRMAFTIRVPRGVVGGISSFNSPLNMVAHKVAPALAAGNSVVFKPPVATPLSATRLFELMLEAGVPPTHINLVHGEGRSVGQQLVDHEGIDFFTFTGSTPVGKLIRQSRGLRPVALELGSIAATIVCADADLDRAAVRCVQSGFRRQGQACTSTQRLFVQREILETFTARLMSEVASLVVGDPRDHGTDVGPMISEKDAARAEAWVQEAVAQGAALLAGGVRTGAVLPPTVLTDVTPDMRVMCEEIFAPVLSIIPFDTLDEAIDRVNATEFGLAAGLFTRDIQWALEGAARLHVGVVHLNGRMPRPLGASPRHADVSPSPGEPS